MAIFYLLMAGEQDITTLYIDVWRDVTGNIAMYHMGMWGHLGSLWFDHKL